MIETIIFFATLTISIPIAYFAMHERETLISRAFYSKSFGIFTLIIFIALGLYLIHPLLMSIGAGIMIGFYGMLCYYSYNIKRTNMERKWKTN